MKIEIENASNVTIKKNPGGLEIVIREYPQSSFSSTHTKTGRQYASYGTSDGTSHQLPTPTKEIS